MSAAHNLPIYIEEDNEALLTSHNSDLNNNKPIFKYPEMAELIIDNGYLFGNKNGRSLYCIILEGLTLTSFTACLFYNIYTFKIDKNENGKISLGKSWILLFIIPLIKNLLLIPDLLLLNLYG